MKTWNAIASPWLEVIREDSAVDVVSPLLALSDAARIRAISASNPLDFFAAHRFLLTLLYWKADIVDGIESLRDSMMQGELPSAVIDAIETETPNFGLFDANAPFLQDVSLKKGATKNSLKSAGSLFAEFASGTNVAHFHHADDDAMRLCFRCATIGMLRIVPWSQSGGAGISPSLHGAPPIMTLACGENLLATLGLNLVPLDAPSGEPIWFGKFVPPASPSPIPFMQAFTWNPRRIHLTPDVVEQREAEDEICWRCGVAETPTVGPIIFAKNEATKSEKSDGKTVGAKWADPCAFYQRAKPFNPRKSTNEETAAQGGDLGALLNEDDPPRSTVAAANPDHKLWYIAVPCTNAANNKTYDHTQVSVTDVLSSEVIRARIEASRPVPRRVVLKWAGGRDGWKVTSDPRSRSAGAHFVNHAVKLLTQADWAVLSLAKFQRIGESPAAFDIFTGLYWPLRGVQSLPRKDAAWLLLKLMASVSGSARGLHPGAKYSPVHDLPRRQISSGRDGRIRSSPYPESFPQGNRLEESLRSALDNNSRKRTPLPVDWAGLCSALNQLLV